MPGEWEDVGPATDIPRNAPPGPLPKGGEKGLATRVSYSPDEQARVQAQELELQDSNLQSITRELANPKLGAKQRAVLEDELTNLQAKPKAGDGWEDIGAVVQPKGPGAEKKKTVLDITSPTDAKDHLLNLWRNESMVGHMYNAYQKGVFEKSMKDLVKSVPEQVKDFSLPELWNSAKEDPRQFAGVLIDSLVADPYLLLAPAGLGGRLAFRLGTLGAKAGKAAEVAAKVAGRGAEGAVAGAALMTPISIAEQLDKNGYVDPRQVGEDMKMGAVTAGVLTAGIHLGADIKGVKPNEVYAKVKKGVSEDNLAPVEALQKAFDDFGIPAEKSEPIIAEVASHDNFDKANAMYSEQVKKGLNPEPPVRQDVVTRQKEVAALLKSKETFESQAPAAEAQRAQPVAVTLDQPTPGRVNEQFDRGEVLGAPAALAKDAAERTEADWVALRAQAKLQDAKASDGGKAAIPELSKDTNLGQQIVGRELPNVVKAKAALELPEQVRTVDDLASIEAENMKVKGPYTPLTQFWPMVGVGTVAAGVGYAFDPNWERDLALGAGAVLAVKAKGGMWHPEAIERLAKPLQDKIHRIEDLNIEMNTPAGTPSKVVEMKDAWTFKAVKNYLNKHAGTESDPLKDVEIPFGAGTKRWEEVTDRAFGGRPARQHASLDEQVQAGKIPFDEPVWDVHQGAQSTNALKSYLSHVGDYLREFVPSEKLGQYDLVRAVKETAAQDIKQAKKMADARASGAGTTVFKEYPDGMKWVEVGKGSSKDVNEAALKNEGDVMGHCFPPGTLVNMAEPIPIEDIQLGNDVVTHTGAFRKVTKLFHRTYSGKLVKLSTRGGSPVSCTPEHPILIVRPVSTGSPWQDRFIDKRLPETLVPQWCKAFDIKPGDYMLSPGITCGNPVESPLQPSEDLAWLLGFYAGDGDAGAGAYVGFTLSPTDDANRVLTGLSELGLVGKVTDKQEYIRIRANSKAWSAKFKAWFGNTSQDKHLPEFLFNRQWDLQAVLGGLMAADGTYYEGRCRLSSTSQKLIQQAFLITVSLGYRPSIKLVNRTTGFANASPIWNIEWQPAEGKWHSNIRWNSFYATPVVEREFIDYSGPVYNIEVEYDHSYLVNGLATHNCVGGYCEAVHEGSSKIYSLRDAKGESHVTVEVRPEKEPPFNKLPEEMQLELHARAHKLHPELKGGGWPAGGSGYENTIDRLLTEPKYQEAIRKAPPDPQDILQIKGKQNRAPVAAYLPYVQDFVKGGKWGEVGDLRNAGLVNFTDLVAKNHYRNDKVFVKAVKDKLGEHQYYSAEDLTKLWSEYIKGEGHEPPFKSPHERGSIDPEFARYLALGAAGALVGSYLADDKATGTLLGAALAAGGLPLLRAATKIVDKAGETLVKLATGPRDTRYRIDGMINDYQEGVARGGISAMRAVEAFKQLVPQIERRNELTHFIQTGGDKGPRTAAEQEYVRLQVHGYKGILENEKRAGVIEQGIEDGTYVAQYWSGGKDEILKAQRIFSAMSQKNPNAMQRVIPDYQTGMNAGLTPKTLDSAEIMGIRMRSSATVIERQKFMERLKEGRTPTNEKLIVPLNDSKAAVGYEQIKHPALLAYRVHPDIAPSLRTLYSALEPHAILDALNLVSSASKRAIFSMSLFHPMSLTMALLARPRSLSYLPEAYRSWMGKSNSKLAEQAIVEGGVKVEPKRGVDVEYDLLQRAMGRMIDSSAGLASKGRAALTTAGAAVGFYASDYEPGGALAGAALAFGGGRKGLQMAKVVDQKMQELLWGKLHPTYKIAAFAAEYEQALKVNSARVAKGEPGKPLRQIAKEVGGSVNDFFGGQNWAANGEAIQNKFGRNLALALAQPDSQRLMQLIFQAPDWLVSTYKSIAKALPGVAEKDVAKVHRSYIINSMLMYAAFGDMLNVQLSGHHFWENKDWTRIDLGNGQTMQTNKHFMEFFHWLSDPGQVFYNKLAFWPSEIAEQVENRKWLTSGQKKPAPVIRKESDSAARQTGETLGHVAKRFWPISGSQDSAEKAFAGFMGMPIYGETDTARADRMDRQKEQRNTPEARELRRTKRELKREKENR